MAKSGLSRSCDELYIMGSDIGRDYPDFAAAVVSAGLSANDFNRLCDARFGAVPSSALQAAIVGLVPAGSELSACARILSTARGMTATFAKEYLDALQHDLNAQAARGAKSFDDFMSANSPASVGAGGSGDDMPGGGNPLLSVPGQ